MATNKNITMKQYNGTDYDTVYPATTIKQVQGLSDELNSNELPVGTIMDSVDTNFPSKMKGTWFPCDGKEVDINAYPDLANIITESVNLNFQSDSIDMNVDVPGYETFGGQQYTLAHILIECVEYYGNNRLFTCYAQYDNFLYRVFYILSDTSPGISSVKNRIIDSGILGNGFITHREMGGVKYILTYKVIDADNAFTHEVLFHFDKETEQAVIDFEGGDEGLDVNWEAPSLSFACVEGSVYSYVIGTGTYNYTIYFAGSIPELFMSPMHSKTVYSTYQFTEDKKTLYTVLNDAFLLYTKGMVYYIKSENLGSGEFNVVLDDANLNEPILPEDIQTSGNYIYFLSGQDGRLYYFDTITHTALPLELQSPPYSPYRFVVPNDANYVAYFSSISPGKKLLYSIIHENEQTHYGSHILSINGEYTQRNSETNGFIVCECIENNPVDRKITLHILESINGLVAKVIPNITNTGYYSYIKASLN